MAFKLFDRVQETASTTGTGDFTLSGAIPGFKTFASRYSTGDTLYYVIQDVDTSGAPDGDWEVGLGTYSAANTLTRTTVLSSSNSDALVSFASGEKYVSVTMTALQGASIRERVTTSRTYYVRTDGSDSNNGSANTSGGAFLTIQKAIDVVLSTLDIASGVTVTVKVGDGTYTGAVVVGSHVGSGSLVIDGNTTTPANCIISTTSATAISTSKANCAIKGFKIQTTTSGYGFIISDWSSIVLSNINFGACLSGHIAATTWSVVNINTAYTISGAAPVHYFVISGARMTCASQTVTITGTPAFSTAYLLQSSGSTCYLVSTTYSGSATGKRYDVTQNSIADTGGATLPGGTVGTTATGGQYL